jgi:hypothetical protein
MDPETFERVATPEELDREYTESERAQADAMYYGDEFTVGMEELEDWLS